ncbi:MAG: hypothetical protein J6R85_02845 [Lentisphaeria bacterium]|nr:hypothetical protein [Lentisphaeria bacterium]
MSGSEDFLKTPVWYPVLASHTFLTSFIRLRPEAVKALADGCDGTVKSAVVIEAIESLRAPMAAIPGHCFASVDCCSPTDTERFITKGGAVFSPESAWRYLARSAKVRAAAERGDVEYICLRPYRRMNRTREFRLFIRNGELNAMSQYHLTRHFRRLEGVKQNFWHEAKAFVNSISWLLPVKDLVMDVYFTSSHRILIVDLNPWGAPTDPLLLRRWTRDWEESAGIVLMPPPLRISGDVNVSF